MISTGNKTKSSKSGQKLYCGIFGVGEEIDAEKVQLVIGL